MTYDSFLDLFGFPGRKTTRGQENAGCLGSCGMMRSSVENLFAAADIVKQGGSIDQLFVQPAAFFQIVNIHKPCHIQKMLHRMAAEHTFFFSLFQKGGPFLKKRMHIELLHPLHGRFHAFTI